MSQLVVEQPLAVSLLLEQMIRCGVEEVVICAGKRNAAIVQALREQQRMRCYHCAEERSSAFFALGCARRGGRPAAVVTTSGTAVGELLPAMMEAYYSGVPLLAVSADRPCRYRASGAPQCAEQRALFGCYAHVALDVAEGDPLPLDTLWTRRGPAHVNLMLEDPAYAVDGRQYGDEPLWQHYPGAEGALLLEKALRAASYPLVVVGELTAAERQAVRAFLLRHPLPHYCEGHSGLRGDAALAATQIQVVEKLWPRSAAHGYPIDLVVRLGGVPTMRPWRDLEELQRHVPVLSISAKPFAGLSRGVVVDASPAAVLGDLVGGGVFWRHGCPARWLSADRQTHAARAALLERRPLSEPAFIQRLSRLIPSDETVFLGNSMPIREWDLAADALRGHSAVFASRGLNGIDGQLSTFLGLCPEGERAWGLFGDLTTLYDLAAPWFVGQRPALMPVFVVINNGGGKIFARHFSDKAFQNGHTLSFEPLARLWSMPYRRVDHPVQLDGAASDAPSLIEIVPDDEQTEAFWDEYKELC